jgi:cytochrome c biogenesis protein CcdA
MGIIRHIVRGCGALPHVGSPGTLPILMFAIAGSAAGAKNGWSTALFGTALMLGVMLPLYLWGAYDRSCLSERLSERAKADTGAKR